MRASWEAFHASLSRSIRTLEAHRSFLEVKKAHAALAAFAEPGALVGFLNGRDGDLDEKDRLLALLVALVQRRRHPNLATALLWLGLWPGLDAVYRRRLKHFGGQPEELLPELAGAFTALVRRLRLHSVQRVAATLIRSTDRDLMERRKRVWAKAVRAPTYPTEPRTFEGAVPELEDSGPLKAPCLDSTPCPIQGRFFDADVAVLHAKLEPLLGEDAALLIAVLILEETQAQAGKRLGLSHEAARKRLQRALARVRGEGLRKRFREALSQFAELDRV
jgi:hypothetical protein